MRDAVSDGQTHTQLHCDCFPRAATFARLCLWEGKGLLEYSSVHREGSVASVQ